MRESAACCGAILQVLQQGQHQALCMSLMAGGGLSGEGSLDTSVCHAMLSFGSKYHQQPCQYLAADFLRIMTLPSYVTTFQYFSGPSICPLPSSAVAAFLRTAALEDSRRAWQHYLNDSYAAESCVLQISSPTAVTTSCLTGSSLQEPRYIQLRFNLNHH